MSNKPELKTIPVEWLHRSPLQPRQYFDSELLDELAQSIRSSGIIQPIVVRPIEGEQYEIIAGERRWRAAQRAELTEVPCLINQYTDDQALEVATIENVNRVDLNPIEEAKAYQRLIDQFDYIHDEVAAAVGKSRVKISNALRLLKLDKRCQEWLIAGKLSEGHGKVLAGLSKEEQVAFGQKIIARNWSVRHLEAEVKKLQQSNTLKSTRDPNLVSLEKKLSDTVGCRSEIDFKEGSGQVKIDFQNLDILQGILAKLGVISKDEL